MRFFQVCLQSDSGSSLCELEIERTADATSTTLQHMGIQHRCADIFVSKQFLDRADVVPVLEQVRRKTVAQRILTLPMNRPSRSFTTVTIRSTANT